MDDVRAVQLRFEMIGRSLERASGDGPSSEVTDDELVEEIHRGNHDALRALFRRHAVRIWGLGQRILHDKEEAQDLVQEVFWYVFRKSGLFDKNKGSARSWLYQIAYTQAFLRRRHLKGHGFYSSGIEDTRLERETNDKFVS